MSQQVSQPNENIIRAQGPVLCLNNCGFFGNPKTENYCSKCHKEVGSRNSISSSSSNNNNQASESKQQVESNNSTTAPSSPQAAPTTAPTTTETSVSIPELLASLSKPITVDANAPVVTPVVASPTISDINASRPEQKKRNRCFSCSKKVGVLGFECRCDYVFCGEHRLPQFHNCTFDMKKHARDNLVKNNPKVETAKIDKI